MDPTEEWTEPFMAWGFADEDGDFPDWYRGKPTVEDLDFAEDHNLAVWSVLVHPGCVDGHVIKHGKPPKIDVEKACSGGGTGIDNGYRRY